MALDPRLGAILLEFAAGEGLALCATFEDALLELRHLSGEEAIAAWIRASRSVHSLKGAAAALQLPEIVRLAVGVEAIIAPLRVSGEPLRSPHLDPLLEAAALIRGRLAAVTAASAPAAGHSTVGA